MLCFFDSVLYRLDSQVGDPLEKLVLLMPLRRAAPSLVRAPCRPETGGAA